MAEFKLKTSAKNKFGNRYHIPYAEPQVIEIDKEGNFTATLKDEDELSLLLNEVPDFKLAGGKELITVTEEDIINNGIVGLKPGDKVIAEPIEPQTLDNENEIGKSEDEKNDIGKPNEGEGLDILEKSNMPELKQIAKDSGFLEDEWKSLNKVQLKEYLKSKLAAV
jgi:hypothetical protein